MRVSLLVKESEGHVPGEDLVAYEEGGPMQDPAKRRIERHLDRCADCRIDLRELERARRLHAPSPASPPASFPVSGRLAVAWRSTAARALLAVAGAAILAIWSVPRLRPAPGPGAALRQVRPVTFAPSRRGETEERILPGEGPWLVTVLLPLGATEGAYGLRIEAVDGTHRQPSEATITTNAEGSLSVLVGQLAAGAYLLIVDPREPEGETPLAYPFEVVSQPPPKPADRAP